MLIAHASQGIPRTINILCDTALIYGFAVSAELDHFRNRENGHRKQIAIWSAAADSVAGVSSRTQRRPGAKCRSILLRSDRFQPGFDFRLEIGIGGLAECLLELIGCLRSLSDADIAHAEVVMYQSSARQAR